MSPTPPCPERDLLARSVKRLRASLGISQDELAHRAGIHRTYMSGLERARRNASMDVLSKIAAALGVEFATLFMKSQAEDPQ